MPEAKMIISIVIYPIALAIDIWIIICIIKGYKKIKEINNDVKTIKSQLTQLSQKIDKSKEAMIHKLEEKEEK